MRILNYARRLTDEDPLHNFWCCWRKNASRRRTGRLIYPVKIYLVFVLAVVSILALVTISRYFAPQKPQLNTLIREFLTSKESPLAPQTDFLLQQKHWKLLIAISAIESQYCKRKVGNNCFGIGGDSAYRHYSSIRASIVDANDLIEHWQSKGKWLTIESMNCSYVQPCNQNWVRVVNKVLQELKTYE